MYVACHQGLLRLFPFSFYEYTADKLRVRPSVSQELGGTFDSTSATAEAMAKFAVCVMLRLMWAIFMRSAISFTSPDSVT